MDSIVLEEGTLMKLMTKIAEDRIQQDDNLLDSGSMTDKHATKEGKMLASVRFEETEIKLDLDILCGGETNTLVGRVGFSRHYFLS